MWYVLQTMTGREEALVEMVRKTVPSSLYEDCFIAYYERVWRKQQQSIVHIERLFPGYMLIITDKPDEVFLELKHIPAMVKLLSDGDFGFVPLRREEQMFSRTFWTWTTRTGSGLCGFLMSKKTAVGMSTGCPGRCVAIWDRL